MLLIHFVVCFTAKEIMDIALFGLKLRMEWLLLAGILYIIIAMHLLGSCCHVRGGWGKSCGCSGRGAKGGGGKAGFGNFVQAANAATDAGSVVAGGGEGGKEGFANFFGLGGKGKGARNKDDEGRAVAVDGSVNPSDSPSVFLDNTTFKPECCPSVYSNSQGCACLSKQQVEFLDARGGNNVPISQF